MIGEFPVNWTIWMLAVGAFLISHTVSHLMIHMGIQDTPSPRSSHKKPTPKGGGLGIILGFLFAMGVLYLQGKLGHVSPIKLICISMGAGLTIFVSLWDDVHRLSSSQKLIGQIITSLFVIGVGLKLRILPTPFGSIILGGLGGVLAFFWIIFFMNVFNFMDGLNGLASGVSLISCLFCALIAYITGEVALFYVSFFLGFATAGFFILNFPKAHIFMGDVGSQFIGFLWGVLLLIPSQASHTVLMKFSVYTVPLLFFSFIYDVCVTVGRRIWRKERFWLAHRTHLFQLLNRVGYSHTQITCFHGGMAILQGVGAFYMQFVPASLQILVFIPYLLIMMGYHIWIRIQIRKRYRLIRTKKRRHSNP